MAEFWLVKLHGGPRTGEIWPRPAECGLPRRIRFEGQVYERVHMNEERDQFVHYLHAGPEEEHPWRTFHGSVKGDPIH
jgi:hypothetical protein